MFQFTCCFFSLDVACIYGDPHVVTLDLHKYTFNGKGEFVLVETVDNSFTLQGRMTQASDKDGNDVLATVFSAIAGKQGDSDTVQFQLEVIDDETVMTTYIEKEKIDFSELKSQEFNNVTVTDTGNNTFNAIFSSGAFIIVQEQNDLISVLIVSLPDYYLYRTRGLMGIYNNDTSDDLMPRGLNISLPMNSSIEDIHYDFGLSCELCNYNFSNIHNYIQVCVRTKTQCTCTHSVHNSLYTIIYYTL